MAVWKPRKINLPEINKLQGQITQENREKSAKNVEKKYNVTIILNKGKQCLAKIHFIKEKKCTINYARFAWHEGKYETKLLSE